jgi:hypothetical protein
LIYFGQDVVYRDVVCREEVAAALAQLGLGYKVWATQTVHAIKKGDDIMHVINTLNADKCCYFDPGWILKTSLQFANNSPYGMSIIVQSANYPQEAQSIKSFFLLPPQVAIQQQGNFTVTLLGEAEKDVDAKNGITKLLLFFIAAD